MVFLDDQRLGKPRDEAHALEMLTALQGHRHTVCTGVTVRQGNRSLTESESTAVIFRPATETELRSYIATGEPMDQGRGLRRARARVLCWWSGWRGTFSTSWASLSFV